MPDYNAVRHVVPCETAYDDYYDCEGKTAIQFLDFLKNLSRRGNIYRYYYWADTIDGQKYLFFEPDGWGTTHKNEGYTVTNKLEKSFDTIRNNVVIHGRKIAGYLPTDGDSWTEDTPAGWNEALGVANLDVSTTQVNVGQKSIAVTTTGALDRFRIYRSILQGGDPVNLETFSGVLCYIYANPLDNPAEAIYVFEDSGLAQFGTNANPAALNMGGAWTTVYRTFDQFAGAADLTDITHIYLNVWDINQDNNITGTYYVDGFYIGINPIKSENIDNASGYDATSAGLYGERKLPKPLYINHFTTVAQCNAFASNMVNYYKDPFYRMGIKYNDFRPYRLNEKIEVKDYKEDITLPIDQLSWRFGENDQVETRINLGVPRLSEKKLLQKHSSYISEYEFDRGIGYYVY
ncbi:MAG: hypothetical protein ACFFC6_05180 [Promethearchaeota archaeon]